MKIYMIAGEASGDLHGGNLVKSLKSIHPHLNIRAWGGDQIEQAGGKVIKHYKDLAFMGFVEVLQNLNKILKNLAFAKNDIAEFNPDYLILIDYPGFNLRIAKWANNQNIKVIYYILPKIWAWNEGRIEQLKKFTHLRLAILPFEEEFYKARNVKIHYVGHPLVHSVKLFIENNTNKDLSHPLDPTKIRVALLPGSRIQEIKKHIPLLIPIVKKYSFLHFELALAPGLPNEMEKELIALFPSNFSITRNTYHALLGANLAIVSSGTATLETALFQVPQVVIYKTGIVNYLIAKSLVKIKYISLVNLILQKPLVKEIVKPFNQGKKLEIAFRELLTKEKQTKILIGYKEIESKLGFQDASSECSKFIFNI